MVGRSTISPKYERNFEDNRKKWLDAALVYSRDDPDFVRSGAIMEICKISQTKRDMFHYAYRTNGEGGPYASAISVFLTTCVSQEVDFIVKYTNTRPKDIFERDELVMKLLAHVCEEKSIYLIDIRRSRFELLFCLMRALMHIYGKRCKAGVRGVFESHEACMLCDVLLKWYHGEMDRKEIGGVARDVDRVLGR